MSATVTTTTPKGSATQDPAITPAPNGLPFNAASLLKEHRSYQSLVGLGVENLTELVRQFMVMDTKAPSQKMEANATQKDSWKPWGKVLCAERKAFDAAVLSGAIRTGTTFSTYLKDAIGNTLDELGKAAQCAVVFERLHLTGLLPETDYDGCPVTWLTKYVSPILTGAVKKYGDAWASCREIQETVEILKTRFEKSTEKLEAIKASLNGKVYIHGQALDAERAAALIRTILTWTDETTGLAGDVFVLGVLKDAVIAKKVSTGFVNAYNGLGDTIANAV